MTTVWMLSGTIQSLVFYGLKSLHTGELLPLCFALSTITSLVLGSATGTVSTIGVVLIAICRGLGLPPAPVAGAIISGAMVGDRWSPTSAQFHLIARMTDTDPSTNFRYFAATALPCIAASLAGYVALNSSYSAAASGSIEVLNAIGTAFSPMPVTLLPPLILFSMALARLPLKLSFLAGIASAALLAVRHGGVTIGQILTCGLFGYQAATGHPLVDELFRSGGIRSTLNLVAVLVFAGALNGMLEGSGAIQALTKPAISRIRSTSALRALTMAMSVAVAAVTCNQALAAIVPARLLKHEYLKRGLSASELARAIADSGCVLIAAIPWASMSGMMAVILGVTTLEYPKYAFFVWLQPIVSFVVSELTSTQVSRRLVWYRCR